ncbi:MAG: hypothetical protein MUC86_10390 [Burkholderiaceae bacterium]|nr:hypothetical protein [Burkholderiaceae bacterium]
MDTRSIEAHADKGRRARSNKPPNTDGKAGSNARDFSQLFVLSARHFVSALLVDLRKSPKDFKVTPPAGVASMPRFSPVTRHNIAYFSFMALGLIAFWTAYLIRSEVQAAGGGTSGVDGVLGFLVLIPLGIPLLLALVFGPGLSILLWHDRRLVALTVITVVLVVAMGSLGYAAWPILLFTYAAVCWAIDLLWLIRYRRRFEAVADSTSANQSS